jgi:hypothetical protein
MSTIPIDKCALLYFQRKGYPDATVKIWRHHSIFHICMKDPISINKSYLRTFETYSELCIYLDLLFDNILIDEDDTTKVLYVQWDIPTFTSTIIKMENIEEHHVYRTFCKCLDMYFRQNTIDDNEDEDEDNE